MILRTLALFYSEDWRCFTPNFGGFISRMAGKAEARAGAFGGALPALASCFAMTLWPTDYLR